jgi:uncharacterized protein (DUF58 family)
MALSRRLALLAFLGAVVVGVAGTGWAVVAVEGTLLVGVLADLALAGSVRQLRLSRGGDSAVRLGEPAQVSLRITNPGRRVVRALVRDAWPPSACSPPRCCPTGEATAWPTG